MSLITKEDSSSKKQIEGAEIRISAPFYNGEYLNDQNFQSVTRDLGKRGGGVVGKLLFKPPRIFARMSSVNQA